MFIRTSYLRRLTSCLAILVSLFGSLQQCHAFCRWTECETASDRGECQSCQAKKACCHRHERERLPTVEQVRCGCSEAADQHRVPCQDSCWCCRASEPVSVPKDGLSNAQELLASSALDSADYLINVSNEHLVTSIDNGAFRELITLSAAQFCVQLCRFRI
jgi:hypothetical protein